MKQILVTGGAGFIGTNLIKRLVNEGHRVTSLDNYATGLESNHVEGAKYIRGTVNLITEFKNQYDVIFHLAALARIQESFNNPDETFHTNTVGTEKVCEFARKGKAKLVYAGSSSRWCDPHSSPYATTKFLGEEIIKMYKKTFKLDMEIARFYSR